MANLYVMYICSVNLVFNHQHFMHSTMEAYSVTASNFYGVKQEYPSPSSVYACMHACMFKMGQYVMTPTHCLKIQTRNF